MPNPTLKALHRDRFDYASARHLLVRAGFGGTPTQIRALVTMGCADAVDHLLTRRTDDDLLVAADQFDATIMRPLSRDERRTLRDLRERDPEAAREQQRRRRQQSQRADRQQIRSMQRWWLERMIESPEPLVEKLTLFWHGHFATNYRAIEDSYHQFVQNQLFRARGLGDFRELVLAIVRDPAMLRYLNNNQNRRGRPNENLARELLELFTMGEGNGYTEQDIKEGARALTGFTYVDDDFRFNETQHDAETKRIFGAAGRWNGNDFVRLIFDRRAVPTSEFIALKLYRFFVHDLPDEIDDERRAFIRRLAATLRTRWSIRDTLDALFRSEHFYDDANRGVQIKSPMQLVVEAIRSLHTPPRHLDSLLAAADLMGQSIFFPPSVKGWDGGRAWINTSTIFVRQNVLVYLLTGRRPDAYAWESDGTAFDALPLLEPLHASGLEPTSRDAAESLLRLMLGSPPDRARIETIERFIESCGGALENNVIIGALALIAAMPEYQLC